MANSFLYITTNLNGLGIKIKGPLGISIHDANAIFDYKRQLLIMNKQIENMRDSIAMLSFF